MNQIEQVREIPSWNWKENSAYEMTEANVDDMVNDADFIFRVGEVAVAGFIYHSYTSPPWMWFLLAKNIGIKDLVDFRRITTYIPKGTLTAVAVDFSLGTRFAKLYGFVETEKVLDNGNRKYRVMRKV